ncbi:anhydro-N-acetylmuramic acid kinase [Winogradskyella sp.]|uniref:anhydro-N-acetylmuramic acid kinase n=1 Tax=Winogradskyella sp. TaxID=1883156 RepID=UPI0025E57743|nr:anhydro-N-acetylmuramic acid kinase [Winogradskyella sp.]MCT4630278.1 anhydro-N-acetylmuramic acid kinase [Winogradskyella sp.]
MAKSTYNVIAIMSGTSLDGIDIVYATYTFKNSWKFKIHQSETIKYSTDWELTLRQLVDKSIKELHEVDVKYSEYLAKITLSFIEKYAINKIDFIASHGHTALHQPENGITYQIGNLQSFADLLNTKVICDFRVQDVKYGGQGAPLVPIGDRLLFNAFDFCLNLGGFANISFEDNDKRIAFDICPTNIVLNHYVNKLDLEFDDKGEIASKGNINKELLYRLNQLDFYKQSPPKSLGLEWVRANIVPIIDNYNLQIKDVLRTFVEHIAIQISKVLNISNTNVLISGGGAYNNFLISRIKVLSNSSVVIPNKEIIEYKEALVFGLLGILKERNEINCLKSVTGASKDHSSGKILTPNA